MSWWSHVGAEIAREFLVAQQIALDLAVAAESFRRTLSVNNQARHCREYWQRVKADPVKHRAMLDKKKQSYKKRRPNWKARTMNARRKRIKKERAHISDLANARAKTRNL